MNTQTMEGNWTHLKGRIRQHWGEITGDELDEFEGNLEQLVGLIQVKTGEARDAIESHIQRFARAATEAAEASSNGSAPMRQRAEQAATTAKQAAEQAADAIREKYQEAEQVVKRRPLESLALTFAAGLVCGIGATLVLKSK